MKKFKTFLADEDGATAIEYGLIVGLIALAIVGGVQGLADAISFMWGDNNSRLVQALNGAG